MIRYLRKIARRIWRGYYHKAFYVSVILLAGSIIGFIYEETQELIPIRNPGYDFWYYFSHNMVQALYLLLLGFFTYGVLSMLMIFLNGLIIGIGIETILHHRIELIWKAFLPHAIFEILGLVWVSIVPFMIWRGIIMWLREKKAPHTLFIYELLPSLTFCCARSLLLLQVVR